MNEALADALKQLERAERTVAELRAALLPRHGEAKTNAAIAWLAARRLLSDDRAAEATVRPRASGRRAEGDQRLRQRLEARGADEDAIAKALDDAPGEAERIDGVLAAKFKSPDPSQRAKAGRFLLARGFEEDAVEAALDRSFGEG